jgi:hypothetical protein
MSNGDYEEYVTLLALLHAIKEYLDFFDTLKDPLNLSPEQSDQQMTLLSLMLSLLMSEVALESIQNRVLALGALKDKGAIH